MNTAELIKFLCDSIYLIALSAAVGGIAFFSFGVAPIIFKVLDESDAARFVRTLFPRYYAWNAYGFGLAVPAYLGHAWAFPEYRGWMTGLQATLLLACTLVMIYCRESLTPAINAARDAGPEQEKRFDRLHRVSVQLNGLVLLVGVGLLVAFAARPAPTTRGIQEMTPRQNVEFAEAYMTLFETVAEKRLEEPVDFEAMTSDEQRDYLIELVQEMEQLLRDRRERARRRGKLPPDGADPEPSADRASEAEPGRDGSSNE